MKRKYRDDRGFLSLKTGLMTAGAFLATASMGTAILVGLPTAQSTNVFADDKSGFCVTATLENDDSYFAQRGNCGNEETPEPELPEEIIPSAPEPIPEPTPTQEPEPVLPPGPPPVIIDTGKIMVTTWDTSLAPTCQTITLPVTGSVNTQIQWTHGSNPETFNKNYPVHTFTAPYGPVEITINGTFDNWGVISSDGWADSNCLVSVDRWEGTESKRLSYAFHKAHNLKHVEAIPSTATDLSYAFANTSSSPSIGYFNTSNVTNMSFMFNYAQKFNHPLNFDTSKVVDMKYMFYSAVSFNQPLNFDTSNVLAMTSMFYGTKVFDQPLKDFNTSKVRDMSWMFYTASAFNQDLSDWDVSNVTNRFNFSTESIWTMPQPKFK